MSFFAGFSFFPTPILLNETWKFCENLYFWENYRFEELLPMSKITQPYIPFVHCYISCSLTKQYNSIASRVVTTVQKKDHALATVIAGFRISFEDRAGRPPTSDFKAFCLTIN
jgi:hypothetical protein